jgi:polyferredoxin
MTMRAGTTYEATDLNLVQPKSSGCGEEQVVEMNGTREISGTKTGESLPPRTRTTVKKIPIDQRRRRVNFATERSWFRRFSWRLKEDSQYLRSAVQFAFTLLCLWIGIEFYLFVRWGQSAGTASFHSRPPGVEGFLPISSLISLKYWLETGIINNIHPSGLFIFLAILALSLFLKKAFCSWLCPIGTLSESLWRLGQKLFSRNFRLVKWLDYPLRSLKYLLLLFFVYAIARMDVASLKMFIESPYNKVADVKMYLFFADISSFAMWTIMVLIVLSVFIQNFWCRYLCPYGALLGFTSLFSPLKITRQQSTCIDCALCTKVCPSGISVHTARRVWSDECTSCLECVAVCPVKDTLDLRVSAKTKPIPTWAFATLVVGVFVAITGLAMLTGHWQNTISKEEYARRIQNIDSPIYQHFQGKVPNYGPNE